MQDYYLHLTRDEMLFALSEISKRKRLCRGGKKLRDKLLSLIYDYELVNDILYNKTKHKVIGISEENNVIKLINDDVKKEGVVYFLNKGIKFVIDWDRSDVNLDGFQQQSCCEIDDELDVDEESCIECDKIYCKDKLVVCRNCGNEYSINLSNCDECDEVNELSSKYLDFPINITLQKVGDDNDNDRRYHDRVILPFRDIDKYFKRNIDAIIVNKENIAKKKQTKEIRGVKLTKKKL